MARTPDQPRPESSLSATSADSPIHQREGQAPRRGTVACAGAGAAQKWTTRFAFTLGSAVRSPGDRRRRGGVGLDGGTGVLWGLSYLFCRVQATPASLES